MFRFFVISAAIMLVVFIALSSVSSEGEFDIRKPLLDSKGRFWVYKDGRTLKGKTDENIRPVPPYGVPYSPYAWMPEQADDMLEMSLEYKQRPFEGDMCIVVKLEEWKNPYWLGVGFVSGPDETMEGGPWWGKEKEHGWYYDLSGLEKKKFVLHLRGENGNERVQWKVGFLAGEKYGDSLKFPKQSKWLTLSKEWTRYEMDLSKKDLSRVCSLCFVLSQAQQTDVDSPIIFYVDSVYFE